MGEEYQVNIQAASKVKYTNTNTLAYKEPFLSNYTEKQLQSIILGFKSSRADTKTLDSITDGGVSA